MAGGSGLNSNSDSDSDSGWLAETAKARGGCEEEEEDTVVVKGTKADLFMGDSDWLERNRGEIQQQSK